MPSCTNSKRSVKARPGPIIAVVLADCHTDSFTTFHWTQKGARERCLLTYRIRRGFSSSSRRILLHVEQPCAFKKDRAPAIIHLAPSPLSSGCHSHLGGRGTYHGLFYSQVAREEGEKAKKKQLSVSKFQPFVTWLPLVFMAEQYTVTLCLSSTSFAVLTDVLTPILFQPVISVTLCFCHTQS